MSGPQEPSGHGRDETHEPGGPARDGRGNGDGTGTGTSRGGSGRMPRIPSPRQPAEDGAWPPPDLHSKPPPPEPSEGTTSRPATDPDTGTEPPARPGPDPEPVAGPQDGTQPEQETAPQHAPEAETGLEAEPGADTEARTQAGDGTQPERETAPEQAPDARPEAEIGTGLEAEAGAEAKARPQAGDGTQPEREVAPQHAPEARPGAGGGGGSRTDAEAESTARSDGGATAEGGAETGSGAEAHPRSQAGDGARPEREAAAPQAPEVRPGAEAKARPQAGDGAQPEREVAPPHVPGAPPGADAEAETTAGSEAAAGLEAAGGPGSEADSEGGPQAEARVAVRAQEAVEVAPVLDDHLVLKSLLGSWALDACSAAEAAALEAHLTDCSACADEALRLRDAVGLLRPEESLDLDPRLRSRVLAGCLVRRPARVPVPDWAAPYDAETARLDALLHDMAEAEWRAPVRLHWFDGRAGVAERETTVAGVIGHLLAVDGMVAASLGLPDPLGTAQLPHGAGPLARTEAQWRAGAPAGPGDAGGSEDTDDGADGPGGIPRAVRGPWREQARTLIRTVSFAGGGIAELEARYGEFTLPVNDAFIERAFECWVHAGDIAEAVDYPYEPPEGPHLSLMVDLAARMLPATIASRRRAGLAAPPRQLSAAGAPGRTLHLEVEGSGGGHWYIPLDSPAASASPEQEVAHVALDGVEFCQLAAGHVPPQEAAAGQYGDREAIRDVLFAAASLSRL